MLRYSKVPQPPELLAVFMALWETLILCNRRDALCRILQAIIGEKKTLLFTSSGREALMLALKNIAPNKPEVIVPAYGCPIVTETVYAAGKTPIFVDIDPLTFHPTAEKILSSVSDKTSAIIIVHEFGMTFDQEELRTIAAHFPGPIIEDAALAITSTYPDGSPIGTFSNALVLSGSVGKPIGAGSWGALAFDTKKNNIKEQIQFRGRSVASLLRVLALIILSNRFIYSMCRKTINSRIREDAIKVPYYESESSHFDDSLMWHSLKKSNYTHGKRTKVANSITRILADLELVTFPNRKGEITYSRLPFYIPTDASVEETIEIFNNAGIELNRPYVYNFSNASDTLYPNTYYAITNLVAFTIKNHLSSKTYKEVLNCLETLTNKKFQEQHK